METLFEKFNIISCLKKTEFSAVYLADHIFLQKRIILKTLDSDKTADGSDLTRFKREAQILAKLNHPNIIRVLDFGSFQNFVYISFEYFPAQTMREIINANSITKNEKIALLQQAAQGLAYAHKNNIVHRDIKPENILVDDNLQLKIADFGLALSNESSLLTDPASVIGTPAYMSPEQVSGKDISAASDIFSLGLVAYELFNKNNPLLGADLGQTINNILNFNSKQHNELLNKSADIEKNIIKNLLDPDPAKRHISPELINKDENKMQVGQQKIFAKILWSAVPIAALLLFLIFNYYSTNSNMPGKNTVSIEENKDQQPNQSSTEINELRQQKEVSGLNNPISETKQNFTKENNLAEREARLLIESIPPALIFINSQPFGKTSAKKAANLKAGKYLVTLKNDDFPDYQQNIVLKSGEQVQFVINLNEHSGILKVFAYPWAEVNISGEKFGQTPFDKPIRLKKGLYTIELRNPGFEVYKESFEISGNDTFIVQHNFNK